MDLTKRQAAIMWTLTVFLSVVFVFAGVTKLIGEAQAVEGFQRLGLPGWFRMFIGAVEVVGGLGLWWGKRAAEIGSYLIILMLAAVITCLVAGESILPPFLFLFLTGALVTLRAQETWQS